jgi:hypothetical protein
MKAETQTLKIQRWLAQGHTLTPIEALKRFGTLRLGARAWDLKRAGWPIKSRMVNVGEGRRVAEYSFDRSRKC